MSFLPTILNNKYSRGTLDLLTFFINKLIRSQKAKLVAPSIPFILII